MTDLVTFGETALRLSAPEQGRLARADRAALHADGMESSVAVAAAAAGLDATWVSKLPDSPPGRRVAAEVRRHGVDAVIEPATEGRMGIVYHEPGVEPRPAGRWHDRGDTTAATVIPDDLPMDRVQTADVVFSGLGTPALSADAAETTGAMLRAGSGGGATAALAVEYDDRRHDPDRLGQLFHRLLDHVQVVFVSEEHARAVLDLRGQPRELANTMVAEYDIEMAVIARTDRGAVLMQDIPGTNVMHERMAVEGRTVDESGSTEAFVGTFLARLARDAEPASALSAGVAAAALARAEPGPMLSATRDEIDEVAERVDRAG